MSVEETLIIRRDRESDGPALRRLAELDSRHVPLGRLLVAEVEGELVAAVGIDSGERVANPFRPTQEIVELMEARAFTLSPPPAPTSLAGRLLRRATPRPRVA